MADDDYSRSHRNRTNLLIHLVAVPMFVLANVSLVTGLLQLDPTRIVVSVGFIALSLGLQKLGHSLESTPPEPFSGAGDFFRRIYSEQFSRFWLFVISGDWLRNLRTG
jgi:hypothetical protein